jgi:hypothetical protein
MAGQVFSKLLSLLKLDLGFIHMPWGGTASLLNLLAIGPCLIWTEQLWGGPISIQYALIMSCRLFILDHILAVQNCPNVIRDTRSYGRSDASPLNVAKILVAKSQANRGFRVFPLLRKSGGQDAY